MKLMNLKRQKILSHLQHKILYFSNLKRSFLNPYDPSPPQKFSLNLALFRDFLFSAHFIHRIFNKNFKFKYFLFQNMVGPGEVDDDLEPEVKEECNVKYGDVNSVVIFEIQNTVPEESVRIFIEFKRVESAIKGYFKTNF